MTEIMKGNFTPQRVISIDAEKRDLESEFERAALKRLGGSIAFVSKKRLLWKGDSEEKKPESS